MCVYPVEAALDAQTDAARPPIRSAAMISRAKEKHWPQRGRFPQAA
jgi:hypothetical protein